MAVMETGATTTHTYTALGTYNAVVTVTDGHGGSTTSTISLTVTNSAPVITSAATVTPDPAGVGQPVAFAITASDVNNDTLTFGWDFGDGSNGSGPSTTHAYTSAGIYNAAVTVSDGRGGMAISTASVTVNAPIVGQGKDSDGDGFSDAFEIAVGTSPTNTADTPTGGSPAVAPTRCLSQSLALSSTLQKSITIRSLFRARCRLPRD